MEVSVIIPTFGRPEKLTACVRGLAAQTMSDFEVLVGIDGGLGAEGESDEIERGLRAVWPEGDGGRLVIERLPRCGLAAVRNALLEGARGEVMLSLNDDVLPEPGLVAADAGAHREMGRRAVVVVGRSPWVVREEDRLFDRLIRESSMIFFYDRMDAALASGEVGRDHDWGFRHCWGLNFSARLALVRGVGGFRVYPATYGYEDNEMAHRLALRHDAPVLYRPEAVAHHDHRMDPDDYLSREHKLGFAAWGFAGASPDCASAMFGRDIRSADEIAYSREFVERERVTADRLRGVFRDFANLPADAAPPAEHPACGTVMGALYQQHLLLKRWEWRRGLVEAADRKDEG